MHPDDYVERMKSDVDRFNRRCIIGVLRVFHLVLRYPDGLSKEHRRTHTFTTANSSFTAVNCLGTGTVAFHSKIGIPEYNEFDTLRMVDLHYLSGHKNTQFPCTHAPEMKIG